MIGCSFYVFFFSKQNDRKIRLNSTCHSHYFWVYNGVDPLFALSMAYTVLTIFTFSSFYELFYVLLLMLKLKNNNK